MTQQPNNSMNPTNPKNPKNATNTKNSPKRVPLICPKCGSSKLRRSHSRGLYEQLLKYLNQRAYRCRDCSWRGLINTKSHKSRKIPSLKGYSIGKLIFIAVILLAAVYLLIYLVEWAQQDSAGPTSQSPGHNQSIS